MKRETKSLIRNIQRQEDYDRAARVARIQRALKNHGKDLLNGELSTLEAALSPAIGRIAMDAR